MFIFIFQKAKIHDLADFEKPLVVVVAFVVGSVVFLATFGGIVDVLERCNRIDPVDQDPHSYPVSLSLTHLHA